MRAWTHGCNAQLQKLASEHINAASAHMDTIALKNSDNNLAHRDAVIARTRHMDETLTHMDAMSMDADSACMDAALHHLGETLAQIEHLSRIET